MSENRALEKRFLTARDVETLVSLVGRIGAVYALSHSDVVLTDQIRKLALELGLHIPRKMPKKSVAEQVVRHVDRRILKSLDELQSMDRKEISKYLIEVGCDSEEIIHLLEQIDLKAHGRKSREALIEFAAVQISSLGIFLRLSEDKHHPEPLPLKTPAP